MSLTENLDLLENKISSTLSANNDTPPYTILLVGFPELLIVEMREINKGLSKMQALEDKIGVCEVITTSQKLFF